LIRPPARFCAAHVQETERRDRERRGSAAERGYDGRWRIYRRAFLAKYPLCGMRSAEADRRIAHMGVEWSECKRAGLVRAAEQVDHLEPHRGNQGLFWDGGNHQALCQHCSNRKSARGM
jgi:5-methylcytosine-specific restriction protein A